MNGAWILLIIAGLLETGWAIGLKYTDGFSFTRRPLASSLTLAGMIASMYLLALAVRSIPIGTGYAVWTGIGALGAATLGMILFHEPATGARLAFLLMLVVGIIGLKFTSEVSPSHASSHVSQEKIAMYIGTYGKGIYRVTLDPADGTFGEPTLAAEMKNASFVVRHPTLPALYAVSEVETFEGVSGTGGVLGFQINDDGSLHPLGTHPSHGQGPCCLSLSADARTLLVANYGGASVASFPIDPTTGLLGKVASVDRHEGHSVDPDRQAHAHAHSLIGDPSGAYALSADLGMDVVFVYRIDPQTSSLARVSETHVKPGSGPRHIAFSTDGQVCYVVNEIASTIAVFGWKDGALTPRQTMSTLPVDFQGKNKAAEVAVGRTGRFVYASNRGDDGIVIFRVGEEGTLQLAGRVSSGGKSPRHFAIDASGRFLVVANQESNNLCVFDIDPDTGGLTQRPSTLAVPMPVCVSFE